MGSSDLAVVEVTTTTMTDHDRLRPTVIKSSSRNINKQARSVVRKYRKQQNQLQMFRLKEIVPSLAKQKTLDEVSILEETTRYILSLEERLLEQVQKKGLPESLSRIVETNNDTPDVGDISPKNIDMDSLRTILHKFVEPQERKQKKRKVKK